MAYFKQTNMKILGGFVKSSDFTIKITIIRLSKSGGDEMGTARSRHRRDEKLLVHEVLVGKPEGNRPLGRPGR
jgi:hypothetical protein